MGYEEEEREEGESIQMEVKEEEVLGQLVEATGRPREDFTWEELQGHNQRALSVFIDTRNAHVIYWHGLTRKPGVARRP